MRHPSYLRHVDASLLEGAVVGVLRADVAILAPVAGERAVDTRQAAAAEQESERFCHNQAESSREFEVHVTRDLHAI